MFRWLRNQSEKGGKDQESVQSSTTPDPGYHMGKWQNTIKHHKREPRGLPFFPAGYHKAEQWTDPKVRQTQDINKTNDPQKKYRLKTVS